MAAGYCADRPGQTRGRADCPDCPTPSSGRVWRLRGHAFPTGRSPPSDRRRRLCGTGTSTDRRCGRRSRPRARWRTSASLRRSSAGTPPDHRLAPISRWLCDPPLDPAPTISSSRYPQTEGKPEIPSDAGYDHGGFKLAVPEERRPTGLHDATLPDVKLQHFP